MTRRRPRPRFRGVCAICDNTNETTQLCPTCWDDPVNRDAAGKPVWGETWEDDDEHIDDHAGGRLAEQADTRLHDATTTRARILDLVTRGIWCSSQVFDKRGNSRGRRLGYLPLTYRDVAWLVGCDDSYVVRVVMDQLKNR